MYLFLFFLFEIQFFFLYMGIVTTIDIHCSYISYIVMYVFLFTYLTCVVSFLSLYTCFLYYVCNLLFLFYTKIP